MDVAERGRAALLASGSALPAASICASIHKCQQACSRSGTFTWISVTQLVILIYVAHACQSA